MSLMPFRLREEVSSLKQIVRCRDGRCEEYLVAENEDEITALVFDLFRQ